MRERIIEALAFPRFHILGVIDRDQCVHGGRYADQDPSCRRCDFAPECQWLYDSEEFTALQERPMPVLIEALEFAIGYIDALVDQRRHQSERCGCEACAWLRDAQRLFDEAYRRLD